MKRKQREKHQSPKHSAALTGALYDKHITVCLPIFYSDIYKEQPQKQDVLNLLGRLNKRDTFNYLGMVNALLSFYGKDYTKQDFVLNVFENSMLSPTLRQEVAKQRNGASAFARPVFLRPSILLLIKLLLISPDNSEGPSPNKGDKSAREILGAACLMATNILFPPEQEARLNEEIAQDEILNEIFTQWLPSFEMLNIPDVYNAVARNDEYLKILNSRVSRFPFAGGKSLSDRVFDLVGIDLERYQWLIFSIREKYKQDTNDPQKLIERTELLNIGKNSVFSSMSVLPREVDTFFELVATDYENLTKDIILENSQGAEAFQQNFKAFRTHPLVYTREQEDFAMCLDFAFLSEKVALGLYHTILNALPNDPKEKRDFLKYWGEVFEIYVHERLREIYPLKYKSFYSNIKPTISRSQSTRFFDAALRLRKSFFALEYKGKYLKFDAKYSGDRGQLLEDLEFRFGEAVKQFADGLEQVFHVDPSKRITFSQLEADEAEIYKYSYTNDPKLQAVYPILIVQDFSLRPGFANHHLKKIFDKEIEKRQVVPNLIKQLSLITIEDLETLIPHLKEVYLEALLDNYLNQAEPLHTFNAVINSNFKNRKITQRRNQWIDQRILEILNSINVMFHTVD